MPHDDHGHAIPTSTATPTATRTSPGNVLDLVMGAAVALTLLFVVVEALSG
jgi:hypothetical protein